MATGSVAAGPEVIMDSEFFNLTYCGITVANMINKKGTICRMHIALGNGTAFGAATGYDTIGTIPEGFRPRNSPLQVMIDARDSGGWASANHYPCIMRIETNGSIVIIGNAAQIQSCNYISGDAVWDA